MSRRVFLPLVLIVAFIPPIPAQEQTREQRIAQIEKQIADLQAQVAALKQTPEAPPGLPADWTKALSWRRAWRRKFSPWLTICRHCRTPPPAP